MKLRVQLQCKNLHGYLKELSPDVLDRLYNHPATCLAVYRELPSLAKNYVMRMLFLDQPLPQAAVALWVKKDSQRDHDECVSVLAGLSLWHSRQLQGGLQGYTLNPVFKDNLRIALLGGGRAWADEGSTLGPDRHARDIESLDRYAMERWEVILHFMVGSPSAAVSQDLAQLLVQAGLMKSEAGEAPYITSAGFQFLLLDTASQLWYFTLQYLKTAQSRGMDLVEILSFLFQLSFSTLGRDYSVEGMSESLLTFLQHLREFGLVFQRKRKSRRYYPTRLAITLAAGVTTSTSCASSCSNLTSTPGSGDAGFIVVETNYRIYAYTNSELQIALVALFSEMLYHFPNVVVAQVTRESVQQAIANGITAQQIIHFLRTRAHPVMLKQTPVLPPTITDQIRLWELERDRLQFTEGVLYNQFLSQADFEVLRDRAQLAVSVVPTNMQQLVWTCSAEIIIPITPFRDLKMSDLQAHIVTVIDELGRASAKAQQLTAPITSASKLQSQFHQLYLLKDGESNRGHGVVVGFLKVGYKKLFLLDRRGVHIEAEPLCVLDFYIAENLQRHGCGLDLFDFMLQHKNLEPELMAYDRPSHKFLSFLAKHYCLIHSVPQVNNFVVFEGFFLNKTAVPLRKVPLKKPDGEIKPYSLVEREVVHQEQRTLPWPFVPPHSPQRLVSSQCSDSLSAGSSPSKVPLQVTAASALAGNRDQSPHSPVIERSSARRTSSLTRSQLGFH
ncbi:general transcription factor IIH subunit 4 isoform X3 [Scophthalmus maximus]|uniref:general transcription factor IIH subunit 4 isoform X3 n=1 Tax=Scophthalmus maximus TaxID=52904 RepID=UPI0015E0670B|nr:general transcription factor IIH subunit 4 isoform X3 [Scophthalmus maximus]